MSRESLRKDLRDLVYLVSCAIKEQKPDPEVVGAMDLTAVFSLAKAHSLSGMAALAAEVAGFRSEKTTRILSDVVRRHVRFTIDKEAIALKLKEAGIWYVWLKGAVIEDYYPRPEMREMSDRDVLFDAERAQDVKVIMESLGYTVKSFGVYAHDVYFKPPVMNFEMHRVLFSKMEDKNVVIEYYKNVKNRLLGDGVEKHFSPEDFYVYLIAHEYKHFCNYGTGLRSVLDTYVYLSKVTLDEAYVSGEFERLGLAEFEKANRSLAFHLFGDGKLTEEDKKMLEYVFSSGTYGTISNHVSNKMHRENWSKMRYALSRFFVPIRKSNPDYDLFSRHYPFFYKHKFLMPLLPFYRVFKGIQSGKLQSEIKALKKTK